MIKFCLLLGALLLWSPVAARAAEKPNVVFIAIDDQNNWIGCLGGHPMAKTPNIDKLAARGTMFTNAHCQAPLCNPSRTSIMVGLRPSTTGIHGLQPWFRDVPQWADLVSLPNHFEDNGYKTLSAGKIYHSWRAPRKGEKRPEFQVTGPAGGIGSKPPEKLVKGVPFGDHPLLDWGVWPPDNDDTSKGDYQVASWAVEELEKLPNDEPFFLAAGFFLPHVPCYATQKWHDLYPNDESILPEVRDDDRDDTPRSSWWIHWSLPEPRLKWVQESGQWVNLVRSYLACTSFVDSQVGRIMDALEKSGKADNTIVVLWGDHGWHLGEKGITGKNTLWERSTKVPLIFAGPGIKAGQSCNLPVELLDMYPTLVDLAGLPSVPHLEGISIKPQLQNANTPVGRPAITSHNQGNFSVVNEQWRYIHYVDGAEELYDVVNDPHEYYNLAEKRRGVCAMMKKYLPKIDAGPVPGSGSRILTLYDKIPVWEGKPILPDAPIPHDLED
ncbi:MAG: sulfatase [Verrucomicrobiales bacterium]|nr:sulfatase [Verrucomicrobiales bacterium]